MGRTESWHLSEIGDMTQTEADRKPKLSSAGSTPVLTFQRTAIFGKFFSECSVKGIQPGVEYRPRNRVHVETALISLRQPPHYRYGGAAFKEKIMYEDQVLVLKYCMQEYGDKFPGTLARVLLDAGVKIGVRADWEIKEEYNGDCLKYIPEFQASNIELDFSAHDEMIRDELVREFIERFPKCNGAKNE